MALLEVSKAAYDEIRGKLAAYGYEHAFTKEDGREVIDMHGIGLAFAQEKEDAPTEASEPAEPRAEEDPRGPRTYPGEQHRE